jgi:hypothetical protein
MLVMSNVVGWERLVGKDSRIRFKYQLGSFLDTQDNPVRCSRSDRLVTPRCDCVDISGHNFSPISNSLDYEGPWAYKALMGLARASPSIWGPVSLRSH